MSAPLSFLLRILNHNKNTLKPRFTTFSVFRLKGLDKHCLSRSTTSNLKKNLLGFTEWMPFLFPDQEAYQCRPFLWREWYGYHLQRRSEAKQNPSDVFVTRDVQGVEDVHSYVEHWRNVVLKPLLAGKEKEGCAKSTVYVCADCAVFRMCDWADVEVQVCPTCGPRHNSPGLQLWLQLVLHTPRQRLDYASASERRRFLAT